MRKRNPKPNRMVSWLVRNWNLCTCAINVVLVFAVPEIAPALAAAGWASAWCGWFMARRYEERNLTNMRLFYNCIAQSNAHEAS